MAGAVRTAVQVSLFGGTIQFLTARGERYVTLTWCQRREDWIEVLDNVLFTTNHHAVASLQTPHATACSYVHIVDALRCQSLCSPDVVDVIGIAAVDENVSRFKMG